VRAIRRFTVRPVLPEALASLGTLAGNLRWSWHPETQDVFAAADPELWDSVGHDPVRLLAGLTQTRLTELAADPAYLDRLGAGQRQASTPT
jgi:Glucan phosphorylase